MKNEEERTNENEIEYAFDEDLYIQELKNHIDSTYTAHYSQNRVQSTEFIAISIAIIDIKLIVKAV